MGLRDVIRDDAVTVFANADEHGEPITYYPEGRLFDPRPMHAVVTREQPEPVGADQGRSNKVEFTIQIPNDPANENGVKEIRPSEDLVDCPVIERGDDVKRWRVLEVLSQDPGMWTLRVAQ